MATQAEFIAFRPGELTVEFAKRAPAGQASLVAKTMVAQTFAMLKAEAGRLRATFGSAEIQIIVTALYDKRDDWSRIDQTVSEAAETNVMIAEIARRYSVDTAALITKIQRLTPGALLAIHDTMLQLRCMPMRELMGLNGFPSLAALRRVGLVEVQGPPAWGLCIVQLADHSFSELVLRHNPTDLGLADSKRSINDLARALVEFERSMRGGPVDPDNDAAGFGLAYAIAVQNGWRHFRVEENQDGGFNVVQISRDAILQDLQDGSLRDLTLEGINAPEAETIAFESAPERTVVKEKRSSRARKHVAKR